MIWSPGLDVLEHIAPDDRAAFVADLARVAVHGVVLSFPAAQAEETERFVARMTGRITFSDHQRFGLPEPADIEAMIDRAGMTFERRPNGCLASWLGMTLLFAGMQSKKAKREIDAFFNERFYELENREPALPLCLSLPIQGQTVIEKLLEAFAVMFITIGPLDNAAVFAALAKDFPSGRRRRIALRAFLVSSGGDALLQQSSATMCSDFWAFPCRRCRSPAEFC